MLAVNQVLQNRYRIIRQLGHGGMGAVYEAIDEKFGEPIALKEIIIDSVDEKQRDLVSKAFEREAKVLAKAKHEAVPYVRDYFFELDRQFLVMELVEGEDFGGMLKRRSTPFEVEDICKWMDQLLDALDYLHNLNPPIIHRDIKPQNLKLSFRRRIKLLDFGIARSGDKSSTITRQTFVGATLNYSPIEQILRVIDQTFREFILLKHKEKAEAVLNQDTDARCDIYALGGTFYHLLTNQVPVDATKRTLDIWEGKSDPLLHPAELNSKIPPSISDCLLRAMAIERNERFATALEMQEALKGAIAEWKSHSMAKNPVTTIQEETKPLIPRDDFKNSNPTEPLLSTDSIPTQSIEIPTFDTPSSARNSGVVKIPGTIPSGNFSSSELTDGSYLVGTIPEEKKTKPVVKPVIKDTGQASSFNIYKLFWSVPIVLIGFLGIAGIGGMMWVNGLSGKSSNSYNGNSSAANKPASNANVSTTPVNVVTVTPTPTANVKTSTPTPNPSQIKPDSTKTPVTITSTRTPKPAPTATTTKTPQDPNCVFTNSCK